VKRLAILIALLVPRSASAQASPRWEYGQLVIIGQEAVAWSAGDSTVLSKPPKDRDVGRADAKGPRIIRQTGWELATLNTLGDQGWEVVDEQNGGTSGGNAATIYLFKRRKA